MDASYGAPYSAIDVILLPGLCFFFAGLFRFLAWTRERNNRSGRGMRLAAWVPVVLGLYLAFDWGWRMFNPEQGYIYRKTMESMTKVQIAHYLAMALPFAAIAGILVWNRVEKRLGRPISI